MSLLQHALSSGFKNFTRNIWLSVTAVIVLAVSLCTVGFLTLISTSLEYAIKQLDNRVSIVVFFKEGTEKNDVETVEKDVRQNFSIENTIITDKEQEKEQLTSTNPDIQKAFELVGNPLSFKLEIQPKSINDYNALATFLSKNEYSEVIDPTSIKNPSVIIGNLKRLNNATKTGSIIVIMLFALISVLVMINILRLAIYNRREEIEIMRLVGATNGYIQSPFVVEGTLYTLVAAIIVLAVFIPITNSTTPLVTQYLSAAFNQGGTPGELSLGTQVFINLIIEIIVGIIIGVTTIYVAIQRYLQK
ncbi:MAG: permease-like cell division protein FtsX [Patescibacteria group bacterium]